MNNKIENEKNYVFSPLSVTLLLSLIAYGLEGKSLEELINSFGISNEKRNEKFNELIGLYNELNSLEVFKIVNIVMSSQKFSKEYIENISNYSIYENIDMTDVDKLLEKINSYVKSNTNGLIENIIKKNELNNCISVFINTIYFKDKWKIEFDPKNTKEYDFFSFSNIKKLQFMHNYSKIFSYFETDNYQHLELDYVTENLHFGIVLPKKESDLVILSQKEIEENIYKFQSQEIDIMLPKFIQESEFDMIPILKTLGVNKLFTHAETIMFENPISVFISIIKHKLKFIINESGTEASSSTVAVMRFTSMYRKNQKIIEFKANHPFSYYLRFKNTIIFDGVFQ